MAALILSISSQAGEATRGGGPRARPCPCPSVTLGVSEVPALVPHPLNIMSPADLVILGNNGEQSLAHTSRHLSPSPGILWAIPLINLGLRPRHLWIFPTEPSETSQLCLEVLELFLRLPG